jgi:hypothetical protein
MVGSGGRESGNGISILIPRGAGANRSAWRNRSSNGLDEPNGRVSKEQVGSFDLEMVAWRRAVVSGE